jgi:hypothetical protein
MFPYGEQFPLSALILQLFGLRTVHISSVATKRDNLKQTVPQCGAAGTAVDIVLKPLGI